MENIEIDKIINLFREALLNKYYLYTVLIITIITIYKATKEYKLYKFDCIMLQQETKPKGFMTNTIINIIGLSIITSLGFAGFFAYKNNLIKNEPIKKIQNIGKEITKNKIKQKYKPNKNNFQINQIKLTEKIKLNTKHIKKRNLKKENKRLLKELKKERTKRKLNEELLKAIQDVN